jgi:hypothetical protein
MASFRLDALLALLRVEGPAPAASLASSLGISQPTLSRLIARAGEQVLRLGRGRSTRYALARPIGRNGSAWPLFRIDGEGRASELGRLHAMEGGGFWFETEARGSALVHGDFREGVFPSFPWFLDDQRPQGFLGRLFARRVAEDLGTPLDPALWKSEDFVLALLRHGSDGPGDLVLGETGLQQALQSILAPAETLPMGARAARYPQWAEDVLRGDPVGSSAGGEQPKFAITLREGQALRPVIVKFSEAASAPSARRWSDLLVCEHLAGEALRNHGIPAAESELLEAGGRRFLQSARFDRTPVLGRRGFVSLAALDAAFYGHGRVDWWRFGQQLDKDGWLSPEDARRLRVTGCFGDLIANTDMHLGNAGMHLADARPLVLAPCWDMLPMAYRPAATGELVPREYQVLPPTPAQREDWSTAARAALEFWRRAAEDGRISKAFRGICAKAGKTLAEAARRV